MKKIINAFFEVADSLNPYSRWIIRIGTAVIFLIYLAAFVFAAAAGRGLDYYYAMNICSDLLYCGKECIGAFYIPAMLFQLFLQFSGCEIKEEKK